MSPTASLSFWQWLIPLGAAAAIFALYFLKTRRHPVLVPSTFLWRRTIEDHRVNALWQRLRRSVLLLLQLLAIALAAVALFRPSWQGSLLRGGRYVFVVDNSASMTASDVKPTRLEEAKARAVALIDKMSSGDSAMIVSFASSARVEEAFTDSRERLRRAVDGIRPTDETTSLDEALRLCASQTAAERPAEAAKDGDRPASEEERPAQVFIFSDGNFAEVSDESLGGNPPLFVPIGTTGSRNVAVTRFAVRRSLDAPGRAQALVRIRNFGSSAREIDVELRVEERLVDARRVSLAAAETDKGRVGAAQQDVVFTIDDAPDGVWEVRIAGDDELSLDDRGWAVLEPPAKTRLLVVTSGNRFLASALATDEARTWCEAATRAPSFLQTADYRQAAAAGAFDLIVFDRCAPTALPASNTLFFAALPPGGAWKNGIKVEAPPLFDIAQTHPLMQGVALSGVIVAEATPPIGPAGSRTLIDSPGGALALASPRAGYEDVVFGFALIDGAGVPQTNWPLVDGAGFEQFALNAVQYFGRGRLGMKDETLRPGGAVRLDADAGGGEVEVVRPDGTRTIVSKNSRGEHLFYDTNRLGPYRMFQDGKLRQRFAVNLFDVGESRVATAIAPKLRIGREEIAGQATWEATRLEGWKPFLLLVLVMLAGEWYIYASRASL
jgi:hypothetical protein